MTDQSTDRTDCASRVTENLIETIKEAHPNYTLTSHYGPDGHRYLMIEVFDDEPNYQAPGDFVSMVSGLDGRDVDTNTGQSEGGGQCE